MSNQREREKRREARLQEEAQAQSGDQRARMLQFGAGAVFLVVVVVVVLIVLSGNSSSGGDASSIKDVAAVEAVVGGIPQQGVVLGDPKAKVELLEFGDLQCPVCKAYSEEILPEVIESQVKTGKAKIAFRNFTIIGEQSAPAGAAALAAGAQGRGWNYIELFYRNQGPEASGYANDEFLTAVAKRAGVKDIARWNKERKGAKFTGEVAKSTAEAERLEFTGTPSFAVKGPNSNGLELLGAVPSGGEIEERIEQAG
jgi:protein-disulfide isomerase